MVSRKEHIQKILYAVSEAYKSFRTNFTYGKTVRELFLSFQASLQNSLGVYDIVYDYIWGKDSLNIDGITDDNYIPKNGDTLIMDISVGKDGVWCDVCRTFFVGQPNKDQRDTFEWLKEVFSIGQNALKVGAKASDIYKSVNALFELKGKTLIHHAGHRVGEKPLLQPQFVLKNDTLVVAGNIYTLEPGLYETFGIRIENDFLLTKDGAIDLFVDLMPLNIEEYILK